MGKARPLGSPPDRSTHRCLDDVLGMAGVHPMRFLSYLIRHAVAGLGLRSAYEFEFFNDSVLITTPEWPAARILVKYP